MLEKLKQLENPKILIGVMVILTLLMMATAYLFDGALVMTPGFPETNSGTSKDLWLLIGIVTMMFTEFAAIPFALGLWLGGRMLHIHSALTVFAIGSLYVLVKGVMWGTMFFTLTQAHDITSFNIAMIMSIFSFVPLVLGLGAGWITRIVLKKIAK